MAADDCVRLLLKHPLVGLECVAGVPHGLVLPQNPEPPKTLPSSRCRVLRAGDGTHPCCFLHYEAWGSRVAVRVEPVDGALGIVDQLAAPAFAFTDEDGVIVHHNTAFARLFAVPSRTLVGEKLEDVGKRVAVCAADAENVLRCACDDRLTGDALRIRYTGGQERDLRIQNSAWRYQGLRCGTIWLVVDATEDAEARQLAALALWYRFGAMFEHELRNPLQTIQAAADVLRAAVPADRLAVLDLLEDQVRSIDEYIGDVLQAPAPGPLELGRVSEVVGLSISDAGARACTQQLVFDHRLPQREPLVRLHRPSLRGVFANLFRNSAQARRDATVRISYHVEGDVLDCTVDDNGPGFPTGVAARSLIPGGRDTAAQLGLLIVTATVEAHGGAVTMSNPPDGGARVAIRLPAAAQPRQAPRAAVGTGAVAPR